MAEHLSYDSVLLETAVRYLERHYSIADHGGSWVSAFCVGGEAIPTNLKTHKMIEVVGKQKGLTMKPAAQSVGTEKTRGTLATYACTGRRRPSMARPRQVPTRAVPDQTEVSNSTRGPRRTQRGD